MALTEYEMVEAGTHVFCKCYNLVKVTENYCLLCREPNHANAKGTCPTCGQLWSNKDTIVQLREEIVQLKAKIAALKNPEV